MRTQPTVEERKALAAERKAMAPLMLELAMSLCDDYLFDLVLGCGFEELSHYYGADIDWKGQTFTIRMDDPDAEEDDLDWPFVKEYGRFEIDDLRAAYVESLMHSPYLRRLAMRNPSDPDIDVIGGDVVLQTLAYGELVFG